MTNDQNLYYRFDLSCHDLKRQNARNFKYFFTVEQFKKKHASFYTRVHHCTAILITVDNFKCF